jgi:antitoxin component YwqK of YwqJK toxin-antitoxin module
MLDKKEYTNGQMVYELTGNILTYYYKSGTKKAEGIFENEKMEGEWIFYRETGQLWQIGHFKNNLKNGEWIRFDKNDKVEYLENFSNGKKNKS